MLIDLVKLNGIILLDDLTPIEHWPEEWMGKSDVVWDRWFQDERMICTELRTSEKNSVILAGRIQ